MLRQLKNNEKGVVFVTVLMIILVMMVLAISVISINVSQVMTSENEVRRQQAETLAMGALAYTFADQLSGSPVNQFYTIEELDGLSFNVFVNLANTPTGPLGTSNLDITVSY
ncbi:MAG: hypothetical protein Q7S13_06535 [Candidatus Omnitrophota bacterium]|jgi:Tfp pilus assembly protein PilX|nr:hypothetical protein [Candidatus Omnitrophota bacterium]